MTQKNSNTIKLSDHTLIIHHPDVISPNHIMLKAELNLLDGRSFSQYLNIESHTPFEIYEDDICDAWTILFIHKMMEIGGHFRVVGCGAISKSLLSNLDRYNEAWNRWLPDTFHHISISSDNLKDDSDIHIENKTIACFSGGLDACFSIYRHKQHEAGLQNLDISSCVMFQGADIKENNQVDFDKAYLKNKELLSDIGINQLYRIKSNFRDLGLDYEMTYHAALIAGMRVFTSQYSYFLIASSGSYDSFSYPWASNPITDHYLASHGKISITDGMGFDRTEKAGKVAQWDKAMSLLRCCWEGADQSSNCGVCTKCRLTTMNFMAMGVPRNKILCMPENAENKDIPPTKFNRPFGILYAQEILKHAHANGLANEEWVMQLEKRLKASMSSPTFFNKIFNLLKRNK